MEKLIYTNAICPRRDDVEALRNLAAETMKKGLISRTPGIQIGSDLLLRASGAKKIVSRPVESGKVKIDGLGCMTVYKVYADGVELGYQVSETDAEGHETLVGERVRTLEAGKAFAKNTNAPEGNQFVALWASHHIVHATRRLRIQRRAEDRVWIPAVGSALVSKGQPLGYVDINDLPKTEEEEREEEACALLKHVASWKALATLGLPDLRRMAVALGAAPQSILEPKVIDLNEHPDLLGLRNSAESQDLIQAILPRIQAALNTGRAPTGVIEALRIFATQGVEAGVA